MFKAIEKKNTINGLMRWDERSVFSDMKMGGYGIWVGKMKEECGSSHPINK